MNVIRQEKGNGKIYECVDTLTGRAMLSPRNDELLDREKRDIEYSEE